ncbi:MAG: tetratricopeptide repeat protein [Bacteroides sp.]|nr:tetratricopeptide repeat protein [Bacteroides sp.]
MKKLIVSLLCSVCVLISYSAAIDEARQLVKEGDFWAARKLLESAVAANPKLTASAEYCYLLGACEFDAEHYDEAKTLLEKARAKGYGPANLYLGRLAFMNYDFDRAAEFYDNFKRYREKSGQVAGETVEELERQLSIAENAMSRVEKIVIIDSISLPTDNFFKHYKLSSSAGRLVGPEEIPFEEHRNGAEMAFVSEDGDYMMWGEPDSIGNVHLVDAIRLTNGDWHDVAPVDDNLSNGRFADFPFMMSDGVTLYYASNGDGSMGGYDIFVASRDPAAGAYLQPQNIGMPFNSPYNDYMMAIDEENGVGWWATDRNRLEGKVTIYVYMVNDLRKNYDPDDDYIIDMARISDFRKTQNPSDEQIYQETLDIISELGKEGENKRVDFKFPIGQGEFYYTMTDFKNRTAFDAMNAYLKASNALSNDERKLTELRRRYPLNRADNVKDEILKLEKTLETKRTELTKLKSEVYRSLKGGK